MSETIVVEAVSDKFKNKYNSGSVLAGGKWMQVSSKLDLSNFRKDAEIQVETKTNDKGYTSIVGIVDSEASEAVETAIKEARTASKARKPRTEATTVPTSSYEENKSRKILVQGVTQAVVQSPLLAGLPFTNTDEAINLVKEVSLALIEFVDEESSK